MADLTPAFNELLAKHSAPSTRKKFSLEDIDGFLKEAYRINSHITTLHNELKDVRQSYLSTAQPRKTHIRAPTTTTTTAPQQQQQQQRYLTDRDREDVDANAKQMLRELNASIRALEEAETLRRETEAALIRKKFVRGLGALGAWAAGDGALSGSGGSGGSKTAEHAAAEARARDEGPAPRRRRLVPAAAAAAVRANAAGHDGDAADAGDGEEQERAGEGGARGWADGVLRGDAVARDEGGGAARGGAWVWAG
ncbi:hypothetical protein HYQ44_001518 [Verticillium longisporum]|nr:hypothetical protein HYQ44_001518 [Verticillium longisporum]